MNDKLKELATGLCATGEASAIKARIETAEKRAKASGQNFANTIISTLKSGGIPQSEIDRLTAATDVSAKFNTALTHLLTTSTKALSLLKSIL